MRIDLLRHGETLGPGGFRGRIDHPLSEAGWQQLRAATAQPACWSAIVSSPLRRCAEFAAELAARLDIGLSLEPGLQELDFGEWDGRTPAELMVDQADALTRFWTDPWQYGPPGGENLADFEARVLQSLARLQAQHAGGHLLLVTHGGVIRLLLARARGLSQEGVHQVEAGYASLHRLQQVDGRLLELDQPSSKLVSA